MSDSKHAKTTARARLNAAYYGFAGLASGVCFTAANWNLVAGHEMPAAILGVIGTANLMMLVVNIWRRT